MNLRLKELIVPALVYSGLAIYLYQPYLGRSTSLHYPVMISSVIASLGCFVLSRRWVSSTVASFFAGVMYGFGPFFLSFISYHPSVLVLLAAVPWLFYPAAFCTGPKAHFGAWPGGKKLWKMLIGALLSIVPFVVIILFFMVSTRHGLFAVPKQTKLHAADMTALVAPLAGKETNRFIVGFYHTPVAGLVMGLFMFFTARRLGVVIIFAVGTVLAFCNSVFEVSSILWAAVPMLCCSILIGIGMQSLAWATAKDQRWLLICAVIMAVLTLATVFFGITKTVTYLDATRIYALGMLSVCLIFFIARAKLRLHWLRWVILCAAFSSDIIIGAQILIYKIF